MTSKYNCETCKNVECECNPITQKGYFIPLLDIRKFTSIKGCASHSDFNPPAGDCHYCNRCIEVERKEERDKVLDELKKDLKTRFVSSSNQWSKGRNSGLIECCNIIDEKLRSKGGE